MSAKPAQSPTKRSVGLPTPAARPLRHPWAMEPETGAARGAAAEDPSTDECSRYRPKEAPDSSSEAQQFFAQSLIQTAAPLLESTPPASSASTSTVRPSEPPTPLPPLPLTLEQTLCRRVPPLKQASPPPLASFRRRAFPPVRSGALPSLSHCSRRLTPRYRRPWRVRHHPRVQMPAVQCAMAACTGSKGRPTPTRR